MLLFYGTRKHDPVPFEGTATLVGLMPEMSATAVAPIVATSSLQGLMPEMSATAVAPIVATASMQGLMPEMNATAGAGAATVTWDPANKGANVVLSNGDLTAAISSWDGVTSTTSKSSGKWYVEFTVDSGSSDSRGVGFAPATYDLTHDGLFLGQETNEAGYFTFSGNIAHDGTTLNAAGDTLTSGTGIARARLDIDAGEVYFALNGGSWFGPYSVTTTSAFFVAAQASNGSPVTANFGATSFTYAIPTGYSSWDGSQTA